MDTRTADQAVGSCSECGRVVEVCGFCGEACGVEMCYRCALVALRETTPQPHDHGG